ncbi:MULTISPECIES: Bbp19 family protein [unclassified Cupriavidus]|uniref:Bbp19 family protein n=1 Tax=unclassified Cupriavidus TaxID=2640874 RepID=UPI00313E1D6A
MSQISPDLYKQIFEDDRRGAAILEHLTQLFARPAVTTGGVDAILQTYVRDGQRRVLEHIVTQINRANGVNDPNEDLGE